jgi:hypothetical protein
VRLSALWPAAKQTRRTLCAQVFHAGLASQPTGSNASSPGRHSPHSSAYNLLLLRRQAASVARLPLQRLPTAATVTSADRASSADLHSALASTGEAMGEGTPVFLNVYDVQQPTEDGQSLIQRVRCATVVGAAGGAAGLTGRTRKPADKQRHSERRAWWRGEYSCGGTV